MRDRRADGGRAWAVRQGGRAAVGGCAEDLWERDVRDAPRFLILRRLRSSRLEGWPTAPLSLLAMVRDAALRAAPHHEVWKSLSPLVVRRRQNQRPEHLVLRARRV